MHESMDEMTEPCLVFARPRSVCGITLPLLPEIKVQAFRGRLSQAISLLLYPLQPSLTQFDWGHPFHSHMIPS